MLNSLEDLYSKYYKFTFSSNNLWPTEFALRALLGKNYSFKDNSEKNNALDLGFGDGRNLGLLISKYKNVYGLEISKEICNCGKSKFPNVDFIVGKSNNINKEKDFFDLVLAVHSIYYCDLAEINSHYMEVNRVLKKGGRFVFSIPTLKSYLLKNATILPDGYARINFDPLQIRVGQIIKFYSKKENLREDLIKFGFTNIKIGLAKNDWWGIKEYSYIVSCNKSI